jgi:tetratricopeptide (TPR) repeat protein
MAGLMRSPKALVLGSAVLVLVVAGGALGLSRLRGGDGALPIPSEAAQLYQQAATRRTSTDKEIENIQSRLTKRNNDPTLLAALGAAYLQKARDTGDPTYYARAETVLRQSLAAKPENDDALNGMGVLALARHQFSEALDWGQRAVQVNPYRAANYGIVGDAQVELGRYDEAVATFQKMVDTRPDLTSYSRVSYIRELYGKTDGAIDAMQKAVNAGSGVPEATAYVRVQLGNLYFNSGRLEQAEQQYNFTLQRLPNYGPAQAGLAFVTAARGDLNGAIALMKQAVEANPVPEYVIALGDLYTRAGRTDEARRQYELVGILQQLFAANGADVDVELALFNADHGIDLDGSLARARQGYERRPSIHAADALAWTLFKAGRAEEAQQYAQEALQLGSRDALKLYHAGMIFRAAGQNDQARTYLEQALSINPHFSVLHAAEARDTLVALGGSVPAQGAARTQP